MTHVTSACNNPKVLVEHVSMTFVSEHMHRFGNDVGVRVVNLMDAAAQPLKLLQEYLTRKKGEEEEEEKQNIEFCSNVDLYATQQCNNLILVIEFDMIFKQSQRYLKCHMKYLHEISAESH